MNSLWGLATVIGPILLIVAIIYAWNRNRKAGPGSVREADRGAERLQDEIDRDQVS